MLWYQSQDSTFSTHRYLGHEGEAQYLHGHTGTLTIEVEGEVDEKSGFVYPCNNIKRLVWDYLKNFDHALILQEQDPSCRKYLKYMTRKASKSD